LIERSIGFVVATDKEVNVVGLHCKSSSGVARKIDQSGRSNNKLSSSCTTISSAATVALVEWKEAKLDRRNEIERRSATDTVGAQSGMKNPAMIPKRNDRKL